MTVKQFNEFKKVEEAAFKSIIKNSTVIVTTCKMSFNKAVKEQGI